MKSRYQNRIELLQVTPDMLILRTPQWGPQRGYGVSQATRANSNETLKVDTGSLYPARRRLGRQKWIKSEWTVSENNQRVKVYRLTAAGKKRLAAERSRWERLTEAGEGILNPARKESEA
jgi:transcriptional regulator